jgi:hypothetical protein
MTPAEAAEEAHQQWLKECRQRTARLVREWWREGIRPDQMPHAKKAAQ